MEHRVQLVAGWHWHSYPTKLAHRHRTHALENKSKNLFGVVVASMALFSY